MPSQTINCSVDLNLGSLHGIHEIFRRTASLRRKPVNIKSIRDSIYIYKLAFVYLAAFAQVRNWTLYRPCSLTKYYSIMTG